MTALDFFKEHIWFNLESAIYGEFDIRKYRMLESPIAQLDNIAVREMDIYKASGACGTIFGQLALGYRVCRFLGDILYSCQSDVDAEKWSKTRGASFLRRIKPLERLIRTDIQEREAVTQALWLFQHISLIITGPGINAQNSDQTRFVHTDESHLYKPGVLDGFEARMGKKWNRCMINLTTCPDEGHDIDLRWHAGTQNEWHCRCLNCNKLIWMLWEDAAREYYNGERVFQWREQQSFTATLESIRVVCPHCGGELKDLSRTRFDMQERGGYIPMNAQAPASHQSYRWNFTGAFWIAWQEALKNWLKCIEAAKLGNLKPHEEFAKKFETRTYKPEIPNLGNVVSMRDYSIGEVWIVEEERRRFCSFDVQSSAGFHLWAQCDEFLRNGDSRRMAYERLTTWTAARQFQLDHGVEASDTYIDCLHRTQETFARCAEWKWYALRSEDERVYMHKVTDAKTKQVSLIPNPFYSQTIAEDSTIGKKRESNLSFSRALPPGWCLSRRMSKPNVGGLLMRLKSSDSTRYYGIGKGIRDDYTAQLHSYIYTTDENKKTGTRRLVLKQIRVDDHSFATSCYTLVGALCAGYFPTDMPIETETESEQVA